MSDIETTTVSAEESNWGVFSHLAALAGLVIPFGSLLGPLVIMLTKGKESAFVGDQARESLNFQITAFLAFLVCFVLAFVVIGFALMFIVGIADLILVILAAVAASKGEKYRYPFALRLVK
jgi:uncharacterized Tic20 family protein